MPKVKKVYLRKNVFTQVFTFGGISTFLPGLLAILFRIFSKFRVISQSWGRENVKTFK